MEVPLNFLPDPPDSRPASWAQVEWTRDSLKAAFARFTCTALMHFTMECRFPRLYAFRLLSTNVLGQPFASALVCSRPLKVEELGWRMTYLCTCIFSNILPAKRSTLVVIFGLSEDGNLDFSAENNPLVRARSKYLTKPKPISEIVADANAAVNAYVSGDLKGSLAFLHDLHEAEQNEALKMKLKAIKEPLELGIFVDRYNVTGRPSLVYASRNPSGSDRADYTVSSDSLSWSRYFELTAVFERWDDFPKSSWKGDPAARMVDLERPRLPLAELQKEVQAEVIRILKKHARRRNDPNYWLSIYANLSLGLQTAP